METQREHSLYRIVHDIGIGFAMGALGGSVVHFVIGAYKSPAGSRVTGGRHAVSMNVPRLGGRYAAIGGLYSAFGYGMVKLRNKEDQWNSILAGAATGGLLSVRRGVGAALGSAVMGGVLVALCKGYPSVANK